MKNLLKHSRNWLLTVYATLFTALAFAQDSGSVSTSTTSTTTQSTTTQQDWYTQPWVWIVGGAVFILLVIALVRSNSSSNRSTRSDRVTVTKKVD
jgi:cell division protein FtsW (lipid II flippase)